MRIIFCYPLVEIEKVDFKERDLKNTCINKINCYLLLIPSTTFEWHFFSSSSLNVRASYCYDAISLETMYNAFPAHSMTKEYSARSRHCSSTSPYVQRLILTPGKCVRCERRRRKREIGRLDIPTARRPQGWTMRIDCSADCLLHTYIHTFLS